MSKKIYIGSNEIAGSDGKSAYQSWLDQGNVGTEAQFLASLKGADGKDGKDGAQGNTGSSVDYPYELVNNVTTDDATKGLSAAQGVVLDEKISQLGLELTPTEYRLSVTANMAAGKNVFRFPVKSGERYYVRATFDDTHFSKITALYTCNSAGGSRASVRNNLYTGIVYQLTASADIDYFTIYISGVVAGTGSDLLVLEFWSESTPLYKEVEIERAKSVGGNIPVNLIQGGYNASGVPSTTTLRVRFDRMLSVDELPINITIPDSVNVKLFSISLYSKLDDYSSFIQTKNFTQIYTPKSFTLTKEFVGNAAKGVCLLFANATSSSSTLTAADMAGVSFTYQDKSGELQEVVGLKYHGKKQCPTTGLGTAFTIFPCEIKAGTCFVVKATTTSDASKIDFIYSCDSAGGNRIQLAKAVAFGKEILIYTDHDIDYICYIISSATQTITIEGEVDLSIYDSLIVDNWINVAGVSGVKAGKTTYYGDEAISLKPHTKRFLAKSADYYTETYNGTSWLKYNQSMAIYNGVIVLFQDSSMPDVRASGQSVAFMDYATKTILGYAENPVSAHCNSAQFSDIFYDESDPFPLLMLSDGNYPSANSPTFHIIRITGTSGNYTLSIVKTITCSMPIALNNGSWVANFRQNRLFMYTLTLGDWQVPEADGNRAALVEFELPDITDGTPLTLSQNDVVRYTQLDYFTHQGSTEFGGLLFIATESITKINGLPYPNPEVGTHYLQVINPDLGRVVNVVPFTGPEAQGVAEYNGKLYVSQKNSNATSGQLSFQIQEFDFGPED